MQNKTFGKTLYSLTHPKGTVFNFDSELERFLDTETPSRWDLSLEFLLNTVWRYVGKGDSRVALGWKELMRPFLKHDFLTMLNVLQLSLMFYCIALLKTL